MKIRKIIAALILPGLLMAGLLAVNFGRKNSVDEVRATEPNASYSSIYSDGFNNTQKFDGYNQVLIVYSGTAHGLTGGARTITDVIYCVNGRYITLSDLSTYGRYGKRNSIKNRE
jgi:hypothetical protein